MKFYEDIEDYQDIEINEEDQNGFHARDCRSRR